MFSHFFIDRPIFATVVCLVILLLGIVSIPTLPVEQFPDIVPPTVSVTAMYPGASAEVVATAVAIPLEEALNGVDNMIYMATQATSDGTLSITVSFEVGTDPDIAQVLVNNRVQRAMPLLPEEVRRMGVNVDKRSADFICVIALFEADSDNDQGAVSGQYLANFAALYLRDRLMRVPGVGNVMAFDRRHFSMRIWLDEDAMAARAVSVQEVHAAVRAQNVQVAAGRIGQDPVPDGVLSNMIVVTLGRLQDAAQFENIILRVDERGGVLRLRDVALIELGSADYTVESRYNGRMSTGLAVSPRSGANALEVADGVVEMMESLRETLERSGLDFAIPYNATDYIRETVHMFWETLLLCILFVSFTIFMFLQDWRAAIIPIMMIPVAIIGTFFLIWCVGFSINTMTLFGLIVVIGIVVDDSIIVVENTQRLIDEEHLDPYIAAKKSMTQVTGPIFATSLVMMAIFLPTSMMEGIVGKLYQQFALTIAGAIVLSTLGALTLSPALAAILLRPSVPKPKRFIAFRMFNFVFDGFVKFYMKTVKTMIFIAPVILMLWFGLVALLLAAVMILPHGFVPGEDQGFIMVEVRLPEGASMERTAAVLQRVERVVMAEQTVTRSEEYYQRGIIRRLYERFWDTRRTYVESGGVKSSILINGFSFVGGGSASNLGMVLLPLDGWSERRDQGLRIPAIQARLQQGFNSIPEAQFQIMVPPPIRIGMVGGVDYVLLDERGVDPRVFAAVRDDLVQRAWDFNPIAHVMSPFNPNSPQLYLDIDRDKAMRMGVPLPEIFASLQSYLGTAYINDFNLLGRTFRVNVQAKGEYRATAQDVLRMTVKNNNGEMVPIGAFTTLQETAGPQMLTRYNMFPSISIIGFLRPGASTGDGIRKMEELSQDLPDGFTFEWTGLTFQEKRVGNQTALFFAISIMFAFLILAAQYESWSAPLIIMMAVPLGIGGALLAVVLFAMYAAGLPPDFSFISLLMWLMSAEINLYTQIGLLLMVGLSAKNAILIVEFARKRRATGAGLVESAYEAGRMRVRPIFMTSFALILGMLPLVFADGAGGNSRNAIGNGIFGGLLAETMIGVYVTPVLFVLVMGISEWFNKHMRAALKRSQTEGRGEELPEVTVRHGI